MELSKEELETIREWYDLILDLNCYDWFEEKDKILIEKIRNEINQK